MPSKDVPPPASRPAAAYVLPASLPHRRGRGAGAQRLRQGNAVRRRGRRAGSRPGAHRQGRKPAPFLIRFVVPGQIEGSKEVEVRARVSGILQQQFYKEGDAVKAGAPLFALDRAPFEVALAQARGQLAQATAQGRPGAARGDAAEAARRQSAP